VGLVKDAHFQAKSAILSTESGIVASLNQRTNKIGTDAAAAGCPKISPL
jgi:hypothetical protein